MFARRLSFLITAGVPLVESVEILRAQARSRATRSVYASVARDLQNGQFLAKSLEKHRRHFGDFAINLIRAGETSGILIENLRHLAEELDKRLALRRKVTSALIYPAFITAATLGVTGGIVAFIFPKLLPVFSGLHVDLPLTTRILIGISEYLRHWGLLTVSLVIFALVAFFYIRARFERIRYLADAALLHLPLCGGIARRYNLANSCRTLGLLLRSGVHVTEALNITAQTTHNRVYRASLARFAVAMTRGERLSSRLEAQPALFPAIMAHLVGIGETTGNLSGTLLYLSQLYEGEVDELTKNLSSSIEPALMVIMGLLVGLVAISVITPLYAITQHLQPR